MVPLPSLQLRTTIQKNSYADGTQNFQDRGLVCLVGREGGRPLGRRGVAQLPHHPRVELPVEVVRGGLGQPEVGDVIEDVRPVVAWERNDLKSRLAIPNLFFFARRD